MFDLWVRDTEITALITATAVLAVLPIQLILCFRAKKRFIKLLPAVVFGVMALVFYVIAITSRDWSALIYVIIAIFSGVLLLFSGIAWGIWAITRLFRKKRSV